MTTLFCHLGQGLPLHAVGASRWVDAWHPLDDEDRVLFERFPSARFIVRPWHRGDDPRGKALPADMAYDHIGGTIVFRSGQRLSGWKANHPQTVWWEVHYAESLLADCPALGADVEPSDLGAPCELDDHLGPGGCVYVDAHGTFQLGAGRLIALRNFNEGAIEPGWRRFLVSWRDERGQDEAEFNSKLPGLMGRTFSYRTFASQRGGL